jgi:mannose-1-phosphate guanylyltransferase
VRGGHRPASREGHLKQFIKFFGKPLNIQEPLLRLSDPLFEQPIVITTLISFAVNGYDFGDYANGEIVLDWWRKNFSGSSGA